MRKLAERTTNATKEIAQILEVVLDESRNTAHAMNEGRQDVEEGLEGSRKAGESLERIIGMATRVGDMVTQIATAATEQASATEDIQNSAQRIAGMATDASQAANTSAEACEHLNAMAQRLQEIVSVFRVSGHNSGARTYRGHRSSRSGFRRRADRSIVHTCKLLRFQGNGRKWKRRRSGIPSAFRRRFYSAAASQKPQAGNSLKSLIGPMRETMLGQQLLQIMRLHLPAGHHLFYRRQLKDDAQGSPPWRDGWPGAWLSKINSCSCAALNGHQHRAVRGVHRGNHPLLALFKL